MEAFFLTRPTAEYAEALAAARQEFLLRGCSAEGSGPFLRLEDPLAYIEKCAANERAENLPEGYVPATQFIAVREADKKVIGFIQVRHYLNGYLEKYSGHIGYSVLPDERRKGYAKEMLRRVLPFCREIGMEKALVTCKEHNFASERTILTNGGKYASTEYEPDMDVNVKRFWIEL